MTVAKVRGAVILVAMAACCLARPPVESDHHTGCNPTEDNFIECFMNSGNSIFRTLNKGDRNIGLPVLDPLEVQRMDLFNKGEHMHLEVMNTTHRGLGTTVITKALADPEHFKFKLDMFVPTYNVKGTYNMDTKVSMMPVVGQGDFEFTLVNSSMSWDILGKPVEKNEDHYMKITDFKVSVQPKGMTVKIDNLFNGNKELGETINTFFNKNWKVVFDQLRPAIQESYSQLMKTVGSQLLEKSSLETMFPRMHI